MTKFGLYEIINVVFAAGMGWFKFDLEEKQFCGP